MKIDAGRFTRHIDACNNAVLPEGRVRLHLGGAPIGYVLPQDAPATALADAAAFQDYVAGLAAARRFEGRGEAFDVRDEASGLVLATVDRGAIPLLGVPAQGVHLNGLVYRADGLHLWVGRRAADKKLDPGKLDHITAGGIAAGHDAWSTLLKEAAEEASLPVAIVAQARPAGSLRYTMCHEQGLRRDLLQCYDLYLPQGTIPQPRDGEVEDFRLWKLTEVLQRVAETDDFKFNVNLVLIALFLRTGLIDATTPAGREIEQAMMAVRVK